MLSQQYLQRSSGIERIVATQEAAVVRNTLLAIVGVAAALGVTGCGANLYRTALDDPQARKVSAAELALAKTNTDDLERLKSLFEARSEDAVSGDFPIGPGDVLEISVPAIPELASRVERVSVEGDISLPYIGKVKAAGMTQEALDAELHKRLLTYMHNPRIFLTVKEYNSRQVAVLGSVMRPGMYTLTSSSDTLFDLVTRAGGVTTNADPIIQIIPAEEAPEEDEARVMEVASKLPRVKEDPAALVLKRTEPIVINTSELAHEGLQKYLYLPARPGDVVMVPGGAQVLVEGWVERPGAYPVTAGLTVTGVVAAAGGPQYPADLEHVKVIRPEKDGTKSVAIVDLEAVKGGDKADLRLKGGDIIEVTASDGKLLTFGMYKMFSKFINVSAGVPAF